MTENKSELMTVHTLANRFEADVLMEALIREGIPALLRGFEETPYTGLFVPQKGWGRIMVPSEMELQAREIIDAVMEDVQLSKPLFESASDIDPRLWERLRQADSNQVTRDALVEFDPDEYAYIVPFFNSTILCYPESEKMEIIGPLSIFSQNFQLHLVVLHYLLEAQNEPLSGKWIGEKDLPSGTLFFQGPHALPVEPLTGLLDAHPELFEHGAAKIGGEKSNQGDISYGFRVLPRIPLLIIFWKGDEEFEPSFHVLFDDSITYHLESLDLVWALVNIFTRILAYSATQEGDRHD